MAKPKRICSVVGCGKFCRGHGYCHSHYRRWVKYGDPLKGHTYKGAVPAWCAANVGYAGDECLKWPFGDRSGKALIRINGRNIVASRYMCILAHGEPPTKAHEAAHNCGKGKEGCVNPKHLRWATRAENIIDMVGHGTAVYGEINPMHKLTTANVMAIHAMRHGNTGAVIALKFGVCRQTISNVLSGKSWRHLGKVPVNRPVTR